MNTVLIITTFMLLLHEISWIVATKRKVAQVERYKALTELNDGKDAKEWDKEYRETVVKYGFLLVLVVAWFWSVLISNYWMVGVAFMVANIVGTLPKRIAKKGSIILVMIHFLESLFNVVVLLFMILNHYHLHYDMEAIIKNLIN